jgi:hypothetical protein|tara:strand:+ start:298 stop:1110 length:813 start_codon:yes stop_codon:yes gene_type:complete
MNNSIIFCLCLNNNLINTVKQLDYIPVGLGKNDFSEEWLRDSTGENISQKNMYYGEHSFHYWFWKNYLENIEKDKWVGFCAYRRFWQKDKQKLNTISNFRSSILNKIPTEWEDYDVILGDKINLDIVKWTKVIKYGKIAFLRNPKSIYKKGRTIRFHFDMFHGNGILDKALDLLNEEDKEDFRKYINENTSYNQGNMFVCKSKKIMKQYYKTIFEWLEKCEQVFGFDLVGYGNIRLYAFLAERFMPYWFNKNAKVLEWPILFHDLNNEKI